MKPLRIAAGIICNRQGEIFITQRLPGVHMAHKWEFPGGKIEPVETPLQALGRELQEEIGICISRCTLLSVQTRYLKDRGCPITLWFFLVTDWQGVPWGKEGQSACWLPQQQLPQVDFPMTNMPVVRKLCNMTLW